ncbi:MAG: hypothetical protein GY865_16005 [candidate division Zixibacteria bacterium]|nr:hypothetical protein [candidate division Zixibacteria bacterium]
MNNCKRLTITNLTIAVIFSIFIFSVSSAQDVTTGQAVANVLAILSVTAAQDLDFGNILQGVTSTVTRTDAVNSGIFQVSGEGAGNSEVSMYMQLPDYLWNGTPGSQDRLTIYFKDTDCTIDTTNGTPDVPGAGALIGEDPHNIPDTGIGGNDNVVRIYMGGAVYPAVDQRAGAYSADIILTAAYTGD